MTKTVADKLGLKPGMTGWSVGRPADVAGLEGFAEATPPGEPDVILAFVRAVADVRPMLDAVLSRYRRGASLWFVYPKKTGAIRTDITRDHGWDALAEADLLAVTQIAVDETWSALRFRRRDEIKVLTRRSERPTQG